MFSCKYCEIFKNTYFEELLWTAASENTCFFIKHSELISFLYKNKNEKKRDSMEITETYIVRKNCNKIKYIWATAVQFFEKYWFRFFSVLIFKQTKHIEKSSSSNRTLTVNERRRKIYLWSFFELWRNLLYFSRLFEEFVYERN